MRTSDRTYTLFILKIIIIKEIEDFLIYHPYLCVNRSVSFFASFHSQPYSINDSGAHYNDVTTTSLPQRHNNFFASNIVHSSNLRTDKFSALTFQRFLQPSLSSSAQKGELQARNFWKSNWSSTLPACSEFSTALSEILDIGKGQDVS